MTLTNGTAASLPPSPAVAGRPWSGDLSSRVAGWAGRPGPKSHSTVGLRRKGRPIRTPAVRPTGEARPWARAPLAHCRCWKLCSPALRGRRQEGRPSLPAGRTSLSLVVAGVGWAGAQSGGAEKGSEGAFRQALLCSRLDAECCISPNPRNRELETSTGWWKHNESHKGKTYPATFTG